MRKLPFTGLFDSLHRDFRRIRTEGFLRSAKDGRVAYQLAALVKYIIVYGAYRKKRPRYDMAPYINAVKALWRAAEREQTYSQDPETKATFLLRFIYMNLPFSQHQDSIDAERRRTLSLFVTYASQCVHKTFDFNERFLNLYHLTPEHFICLGWEFYKAFRRRVAWTEKELESVVPMALKPSFPQALKMLAAPRQKFKDEYRQVQAKEACQAPYEPNPLLWMPIIAADERYYALYPELVAYDAQATVGGQAAQGWETLDLHPICRSARYLFEHLNPGGKRDDSDVIYSGDKSKARVAGRFAPKANPEYRFQTNESELFTVIATDVLAEGLNLQDCDKIINYDLHWNPVRLIHRKSTILLKRTRKSLTAQSNLTKRRCTPFTKRRADS